MLIRAVVIFLILLVVVQLQSCCMPPQKELRLAAERYYSNGETAINGRRFTIKDLSIVNVRKYTCDSVATYVRIKGLYKGTETKDGADFDVARRLTIVKHGNVYEVKNEVIEQ